MFLSTLGAKTDGIIAELIKSKKERVQYGVLRTKDRRGRKKIENHPMKEQIRVHINSYNPAVSHYNRANAPNRRYLDSQLTIKGISKF